MTSSHRLGSGLDMRCSSSSFTWYRLLFWLSCRDHVFCLLWNIYLHIDGLKYLPESEKETRGCWANDFLLTFLSSRFLLDPYGWEASEQWLFGPVCKIVALVGISVCNLKNRVLWMIARVDCLVYWWRSKLIGRLSIVYGGIGIKL